MIYHICIVYLWVDLKIRRKENKSINQMLTDADRLNANFFSPCIYIIHICLLFALKKYHKFYSHRLGVSKKKKNINRMRDVAYNYHGHLMSRECILLKKIAHFVSISNGEKIESAIRGKNSGCITIEKKNVK